MNDRIILKDVVLLLRIGINNDERAMPQKVLVDITIETPLQACGETDNLALTVDYRPLLEYVKCHIVPRKWNTIEALALNVCEATRYIAHEQHPARSYQVSVAVRKPEAHLPLPAAYPSVFIERSYESQIDARSVIAEHKRAEICERAATLFESDLGYAYIPDIISPEFSEKLQRDIARGGFEVSPLVYGKSLQRLSSFILGTPDPFHPCVPELPHRFPVLQACNTVMADVYTDIVKVVRGDGRVPLNSICVHRYPNSENGLTAHRDDSRFRNVVMILTLKGSAEFFVGKSVEDIGEHERRIVNPEVIRPVAGSLILQRAPRNNDEKGLRPFHAVGPITEERISLIFQADNSVLL